MPKELPCELYDHIIDFLWDDVDALRACSLTCRQWLPASRYHLFFPRRLICRRDVRHLNSLLDAAKTGSTQLDRLIRDLKLNADWSMYLDISPILPRLKHVETLRLYYVDWSAKEAEKRELSQFLFSFSSEIRALYLERPEFAAPSDLLQIMTAFPKLSTLVLTWPIWPKTDEESELTKRNDIPDCPPAPIKELVLRDGLTFMEKLIPQMLKSPNWCLLKLDIEWHRDSIDAPLMQHLLTSVSGTLQHLRLGFAKVNWFVSELSSHPLNTASSLREASFLCQISLSVNVRLITLEVELRDYDMETQKDVQIWVPSLLAGIRSAHLQQIRFRIGQDLTRTNAWGQGDTEKLDWECVDNVLKSLNGVSYHQLVVVLDFFGRTKRGWIERVAQFISPRLPRAREVGVHLKLLSRQSVPPQAGWM